MHHMLAAKAHHFLICSHSVVAGMTKDLADMCPVLSKLKFTMVAIR